MTFDPVVVLVPVIHVLWTLKVVRDDDDDDDDDDER